MAYIADCSEAAQAQAAFQVAVDADESSRIASQERQVSVDSEERKGFEVGGVIEAHSSTTMLLSAVPGPEVDDSAELSVPHHHNLDHQRSSEDEHGSAATQPSQAKQAAREARWKKKHASALPNTAREQQWTCRGAYSCGYKLNSDRDIMCVICHRP